MANKSNKTAYTIITIILVVVLIVGAVAFILYEQRAAKIQESKKGAHKPSTNNKNILQYMVEDLGFSVDPHLHPSDYNYADLAYLIEQLGVEPSGVIGGLVTRECVHGEPGFLDWENELDLSSDGYVHGKMYSDYKWKPEILSGAGSAGHWIDDLSSGMWHPGSGNDFYENQQDGQITMFGQGEDHDKTLVGETEASGGKVFYEDAGYIKELVAKIQSAELPAGKIYTANIHVRDSETVSTTGVVTNEALVEILEQLKPYADAGLIKYVTYQEAVDLWKSEYNEEPNIVSIESFSAYPQIEEEQQGYCARS